MKKPNFFIIGAPKCGTTSMHEWLARNPKMKMSSNKEPHFFSTDINASKKRPLHLYEEKFKDAHEGHIAVGESSTNYLYSQVAVKHILQYNPDSKFVVMIRNPIEMAYSLHQQETFTLNERIRDFEKAWNLQEERKKSKLHVPAITDYQLLLYGERCKLGSQLERLYTQVSRDRVLVLVLDDVKKNAREQYLKVLDFLGVPDDGQTDFPVFNEAKVAKHAVINRLIIWKRYLDRLHIPSFFRVGVIRKLKSVNKKKQDRIPLSLEMKHELARYFKEDVEKLSKLVQRDLTGWLDVPK